ncbi:MAG: hypothetical protein ABH846_04695 [Patescibacteria group bacterium]
MKKIRLQKNKNAKKERAVIAITAVGMVIVIGIWIVQLGTTFSGGFSAKFEDNWHESVAQVESGFDFIGEVNEYLPSGDESFEGVMSQIGQVISTDIAQQRTLEGVAKNMINSLSEDPIAHAAEDPTVVEVENAVEGMLNEAETVDTASEGLPVSSTVEEITTTAEDLSDLTQE